jgi:hypothetical protein
MRSPRRPEAVGSQCESAPSSWVNAMIAFDPVSLPNSSPDCPGQNCSLSGSVTRTGVVILAISSSVSA